jgi:hypothetical protein
MLALHLTQQIILGIHIVVVFLNVHIPSSANTDNDDIFKNG